MSFPIFNKLVTQVLQLTYNGGITFGDNTTLSSANIPQGYLTKTISDKSANYPIVASDKGTLVRSTGSAITITIDNVLAVGEFIDFLQFGAGQVTFTAGSGVTLSSSGTKLKTSAQYAVATVLCVASGQYVLFGDLAV
jgi:hypothetical protein